MGHDTAGVVSSLIVYKYLISNIYVINMILGLVYYTISATSDFQCVVLQLFFCTIKKIDKIKVHNLTSDDFEMMTNDNQLS